MQISCFYLEFLEVLVNYNPDVENGQLLPRRIDRIVRHPLEGRVHGLTYKNSRRWTAFVLHEILYVICDGKYRGLFNILFHTGWGERTSCFFCSRSSPPWTGTEITTYYSRS